MIGGLYLCYEGAEKLFHRKTPSADSIPGSLKRKKRARGQAIRGAMNRLFLRLSIALGTMEGSPLAQRTRCPRDFMAGQGGSLFWTPSPPGSASRDQAPRRPWYGRHVPRRWRHHCPRCWRRASLDWFCRGASGRGTRIGGRTAMNGLVGLLAGALLFGVAALKKTLSKARIDWIRLLQKPKHTQESGAAISFRERISNIDLSEVINCASLARDRRCSLLDIFPSMVRRSKWHPVSRAQTLDGCFFNSMLSAHIICSKREPFLNRVMTDRQRSLKHNTKPSIGSGALLRTNIQKNSPIAVPVLLSSGRLSESKCNVTSQCYRRHRMIRSSQLKSRFQVVGHRSASLAPVFGTFTGLCRPSRIHARYRGT